MKQKIRIILMLTICIIFCMENQTVSAKEQKSNINCSDYYYERLNELGKTIYKNFEQAKEQFWNNEEIEYAIGYYSNISEMNVEYYKEAATQARNAYLYDNPEANIWLKECKYSIKYKGNGNIVMYLRPHGSTGRYSDLTSTEIFKAMEEFEAIAKRFASTLKGTEEEKIIQIHNWLLENTEYDYSHNKTNTRNAYGAIVNGRAVCSGFAQAFKYVADLAGLKVLYVTGSCNGQLHAWNVAYVNGSWRLIDVTYDKSFSKSRNTLFLLSNINDGLHIPDIMYPKI